MSNTCQFCKNRFTERLALLEGAHFTSDLDKIRYRIVHRNVLKDCDYFFLFFFFSFLFVFWKVSALKGLYIYISWRGWLRHCTTSLKVAGSIPDGVIGIFH